MSSNLPPTPMPEPRPFERLALASSELPAACRLWLPVTLGGVILPWLGPLLVVLSMLGGWWRVIALRQVLAGSPWLRQSLLPRCWSLVAFLWSSLGVAVSGSSVLLSLGMEPGVSPHHLLNAWRLLTVLELGVAMLWVVRESAARESRWVGLMMAAAAALLAVGGGIQWMVATRPEMLDGRRLLVFAMIAITLLSGAVAPLLIADGVGRVLTSETDEALDRESA